MPVPARLTRPHSVAARYREDTDNHQVSRAALPRSVRIVHAVVTEAERRGHKVANPRSPVRDRSARDSAKKLVPHVVITVGNHAYSLNMSEEKVLLRGVWEERKRQEERYRLQFPYGIHERLKPYDSEATGSLSISLLAPGAHREGRVATWSDRKSWKLDNKLGELLQELELRSVEDDHREAEERRKAEERHREWELGMERARERFAQSYRAKILRAQGEAWREANALRTYLAALEVTYGETEEPSEWIEWVSAYIERLDPLRSPPVMPDTSEPSAEDLKPFLGGLSPYGPSRW